MDRSQALSSAGRNPAVALSALYDLYRHRDAATFAVRIIAVLAQCMVCGTVAYVRIASAASSFDVTAWPQGAFDDLDRHEAFGLHVRGHPVVSHFRDARDARAWAQQRR